ncbi:GTPase HflX [Candidatus Karelsulcia muelleri]
MLVTTDYTEKKTVLIATVIKKQNQVLEEISELNSLAKTLGAIVIKEFIQKIKSKNPKTFIGKGKMEEIKTFIIVNNIKLVIFNDNLSPSQFKNIEKTLKSEVVDRTKVILDIFSKRAKTSYAKAQIKLAQYKYALSKLPKLWTHLEKQRGGIGFRGPGESEIETDRRNLRKSINKLKQNIKLIDKQMNTQRKHRNNIIRISLVGYTNVGKSTIMNLLSNAKVATVEKKLFSTVDTTVRKIKIKKQIFLLSDTVGFINNLPTQLIDSFKSTLSEIKESDLLIHVIDINKSTFIKEIKYVENILLEIGIKPNIIIKVFNQIDRCSELNTKQSIINKKYKDIKNILFISALQKTSIKLLKQKIYALTKRIHRIHRKKICIKKNDK